MRIKLSFIIGLVLLTSACSTIKPAGHSAVDERLNNIVWAVVSFKGKRLEAKDFTAGIPRIVFDMQDNRINGSDGCNSFMGLATYKGNAIKSGPIASTKMACTGYTIADDFYEILASEKLTWQLDSNNTLRLFVNDAEVMALREQQ